MGPIHLLRWGDWIRYTRASGWYHEGDQLEENGPYVGGIVGFEEERFGDIIQVRADGWMGDEPIYALRLCDSIAKHLSREDGQKAMVHQKEDSGTEAMGASGMV